MKISSFSVFALLLVLFSLPANTLASTAQEQGEKIVMMLNIVNKEYEEGVKDGAVINADEYGESQVFLSQAEDRFHMIEDQGKDKTALSGITQQFADLAGIIQNKKDPADISRAVEGLNVSLIAQFDLNIVKTPDGPVSLERGKAIYMKNCVECHGIKGEGDGPKSVNLDPPPARLADPALTGDGITDPFDNFQIISVGIANTAMQAWSDVLSEKERWDVTYFIRTFSNNASHASAPPSPVQEQGGKIVMMLNIVNKEYKEGIKDGAVINADEYGESQVFLSQAEDRFHMIEKQGKDATASSGITRQFADLTRNIKDKQNPEEISKAVDALNASLIDQFGLTIIKTPLEPVSLERGKAIYMKNCVECHGLTGEADGPKSVNLDPPPARLADPELTGDGTTDPFDNFQIISVGIANTAMQAWSDVLSEKERWDVTYFIRTFSNTAVKLPDLPGQEQVAGGPQKVNATSHRETMDNIKALLTQARTAYAKKDSTSARLASMDAYLVYEGVEPALINKDQALGKGLEKQFGDLQGLIKSNAPQNEVEAQIATLNTGLDKALPLLEEDMGFQAQFWNSLAIIVREGFEAILIIAALITFLVKSQNRDKVRHIWSGVVIAVLASFVTAWLLEAVFMMGSSSREQMEGWIMLLAVVMLFWVSYWLVSKVEASKWQAYITGKMKEAISSGSAYTLGMVAFISVYREGFETILFYKALYIQAGQSANGIVPGFLVGLITLVLVYLLIYKLGIRVPIKWFFIATSGLLAFMAFMFLGRGLHELQMGGALSITPVQWAPDVSWMSMYPTLETFVSQLVLLLAYIVAIFVTLGKSSTGKA